MSGEAWEWVQECYQSHGILPAGVVGGFWPLVNKKLGVGVGNITHFLYK